MSGSMARRTEPFGAFSATLSAAANVPPEEIPQKMPSLLRQLARRVARLDVGHEDDLVVDLAVEDAGHEVGCPALDLVRRPLALG